MQKMSVKMYVGIYVASLSLLIIPPIFMFAVYFILEEVFHKKQPDSVAALVVGLSILCALQFVIVQIVYYFLLLVKMWKPLQDGITSISVGKAIFFSLIPVFRLYWLFVAWGQYPQEFNNFAQRSNFNIPQVSSKAFIIFPFSIILSYFFVFPLAAIPFAMIYLIIAVCKANNSLIDAMISPKNSF